MSGLVNLAVKVIEAHSCCSVYVHARHEDRLCWPVGRLRRQHGLVQPCLCVSKSDRLLLKVVQGLPPVYTADKKHKGRHHMCLEGFLLEVCDSDQAQGALKFDYRQHICST